MNRRGRTIVMLDLLDAERAAFALADALRGRALARLYLARMLEALGGGVDDDAA